MSRSMATEKTGGERAAPTPHADHRHSSSSPILFISGGRPQLYPTNEARSDERIASTEIAPVNGASSGKLSAGVGAVAHVALATAAAAGCHSNHGHVRLVHPLDAAAHDAADPHSFLSSGEAAAAADGGTKCGAAACGGGDTAHVLTYKQADDGTILIDASQLPGISGHLQGVMLDQKGNVFLDPAALDPHFFYEPVQATDWAPGQGEAESWLEIHHKAYGAYADAAVAPVTFLVMMLLVSTNTLPFLLLLVLAPALLFAASYLLAERVAGLARQQLPASRIFPGFIASIEATYTLLTPFYLVWPLVHPPHPLIAPTPPLLPCLMYALTAALPVLHYLLMTGDPGFVAQEPSLGERSGSSAAAGSTASAGGGKYGLAGAAAGSAAAGVDAETGRSSRRAKGERKDSDGGAAAAAAAADAAGKRMADLEEQHPLLGALAAKQVCKTCNVDRPLRSKHCPYCGRCVARFDHHCPAIWNCVGEKNQRLFMSWLIVMVTSQVLYIGLLLKYLVASSSAAALQAQLPPPSSALAALWQSRIPHQGLLLMAVVQMPLLLMALTLGARMAFGIASNLTVNEMINRGRYDYMKHAGAGYCNRFDRGLLANCMQFWFPPRSLDWSSELAAGERAMQLARSTVLKPWTPTTFIRAYDAWLKKGGWRVRVAKALGLATGGDSGSGEREQKQKQEKEALQQHNNTAAAGAAAAASATHSRPRCCGHGHSH